MNQGNESEGEEDDGLFQCAICGITEGDSSNLASQVTLQTNAANRCGHQFCNNCVEREMVRKREFPCPTCGSPVKKGTLTQRTLDAVQTEKDTEWRKRILGVYNKTEKDFPSLKEYNDYLEEIEDMIYKIVHEESDADDYKARVKEYEHRHKQEIMVRKSQRADAERSIEDQIEEERRDLKRRREELADRQKYEEFAKRRLQAQKTQVALGEREEVSEMAAQMQGYKNELRKNKTGRQQFVSPRVREPNGGLANAEPKLIREAYQKRRAAGGGIPVGSIASQERNWNETMSSLFPKAQIAAAE